MARPAPARHRRVTRVAGVQSRAASRARASAISVSVNVAKSFVRETCRAL